MEQALQESSVEKAEQVMEAQRQKVAQEEEQHRVSAAAELANLERKMREAEQLRTAQQQRVAQQEEERRVNAAAELAAAERRRVEAAELDRQRTAQQQRLTLEEAKQKLKEAESARKEKLERESERQRMAQQQRAKLAEEKKRVDAAELARKESLKREAYQNRRAEQQRASHEEKERRLKADELAQKKMQAQEIERQKERQRVTREEERLKAAQADRLEQVGKEQSRVLAAAQSPATGGPLPPTTAVPAAAPKGVSTVAKETTPLPEPQEKKGVLAPPIHGDLKLVIAGEEDIRVAVIFKEYPRSRRSRPLTRNEARQEQKILPVFGNTKDGAREAVIETTGEGIYHFSVESGAGKAATARFTLQIFESSAKKRSRELGTRKVTGKAVLVKILMPEAILWDDESAFTGSMEDSESVMKFNTETGLYWKEYNAE